MNDLSVYDRNALRRVILSELNAVVFETTNKLIQLQHCAHW